MFYKQKATCAVLLLILCAHNVLSMSLLKKSIFSPKKILFLLTTSSASYFGYTHHKKNKLEKISTFIKNEFETMDDKKEKLVFILENLSSIDSELLEKFIDNDVQNIFSKMIAKQLQPEILYYLLRNKGEYKSVAEKLAVKNPEILIDIFLNNFDSFFGLSNSIVNIHQKTNLMVISKLITQEKALSYLISRFKLPLFTPSEKGNYAYNRKIADFFLPLISKNFDLFIVKNKENAFIILEEALRSADSINHRNLLTLVDKKFAVIIKDAADNNIARECLQGKIYIDYQFPNILGYKTYIENFKSPYTYYKPRFESTPDCVENEIETSSKEQ